MTKRPTTDRKMHADEKAKHERLNRQAIQSGLIQPSRRHDLEDKQK